MKTQGWTVQVLPVGDSKEHKTDFPEDCECKVRVDDAMGLIVHDAFDNRQDYEK